MVKDTINTSSGTTVNVPTGDGTINIPYTAVGGKMGWICPQCGRSINPDLSCCPYCSGYNSLGTVSKPDKIEITW